MIRIEHEGGVDFYNPGEIKHIGIVEAWDNGKRIVSVSHGATNRYFDFDTEEQAIFFMEWLAALVEEANA